jgi:putative ABC transport system substrate-binding protein
MIGRREFITLLGGAVAWPLVARAQQAELVRRVGVLTLGFENDPPGKIIFSAFTQGLADLGWTDGRNLRMDLGLYSDGSDINRIRALAHELVGLQPDVILATTTPETAALQRETRTIPIVFVEVSDPVGSGFVAGLARPGGNITGFSNQEPSMASKWVELLSEVAPGLKLIAAMFNPDTAPYVATYYLPQFEAATQSLNVQSIVVPVRSDAEIETVMTALGRGPAAGVVLMPDVFFGEHGARIISLATHYSVPTIIYSPVWAKEGLLLSYGRDPVDISRRAAGYVDRILRGAKPEDLPVQLPTKFELVVNLKTAKAIGLSIPESFLLRADKVIE